MITLKEIEEKLRSYVPQEGLGDHSLNAGMTPDPQRKAAVLILLVQRPDGLHVLFTQRTPHLAKHAGQVSFPGGGVENGDADIVETALREAQEEIGLDPKNVRVLGTLSEYVTRSKFAVTPVVAILEKEQEWQPDDYEVAGIFDVPLNHILSAQGIGVETRDFENKPRQFYAVMWKSFYIWGATAGMLKHFADVVSGDRAPCCGVKKKNDAIKPPGAA
jgi:8-oxo-dGTP pyrophosphatase MutT (NUDIX family)